MNTIQMGEPLCECTLKITGLVEYGVNFGELIAQKIPVPSEGARFDIAFAGEVTGSKISGKVSGIDYTYMRADGRFQLDVHAEMTTEDGQKISLKGDGVGIQREGSSISDLRENITLFTSSKDYAWVNTIQVWGVCTVDLATQEIYLAGYSV
jgi:flagellar basal body rod protein FlgG